MKIGRIEQHLNKARQLFFIFYLLFLDKINAKLLSLFHHFCFKTSIIAFITLV